MPSEIQVSRVSLGAALKQDSGLVVSRVTYGAVVDINTSSGLSNSIAVTRIALGFVINTNPSLVTAIPKRAAQIIG